MAAWKQGGVGFGIAGAVVTLWMTFAPCFLWIFAGAPWIARLTSMPRLAGALSAITAAVVGVIANLSVWFAAHVFFTQVGWFDAGPLHLIAPDWSSIQPAAVAIAALSGWLLLMRHMNLILVLGIAAFAGAAFSLI